MVSKGLMRVAYPQTGIGEALLISVLAGSSINLQLNSERNVRNYSVKGRTFKMEKQYFYIRKSKEIIDQIDTVLAEHYGLTEEELDFIINYDIKYRLGNELEGEEE